MTADQSHSALLADLTGGHEERAEAAACTLAAAGESALAILEPLLRSDQADHRWWALRALGQMASPPIDWLMRALADASPEVRSAAALGLAGHPAPGAASALVGVLNDEDSLVSLLAVNALTAIGKPAMPALLDGYARLSARGRIQGMRALAELRDHSAIPLMMKAVEEDSAMLRYWAEQGLNRLGLDMVYIKPE